MTPASLLDQVCETLERHAPRLLEAGIRELSIGAITINEATVGAINLRLDLVAPTAASEGDTEVEDPNRVLPVLDDPATFPNGQVGGFKKPEHKQ